MAGPDEPTPRPALSRRGFLRGAGLGAAGLAIGGPALLAACSNSGGTGAGGGGHVRVTNLPLLMDDNTPGLIRRSGLKLEYSEYTDAAAYVAQHRGAFAAHQDVGADVVVLPDAQAAQVIASGWVQPVTSAAARARLQPALANPAFDPGRKFSIPYSSALVGIIYDARALPGGVQRAAALFDPTYKGKVVLAADPALTLGLAMLASSQDPSRATAGQASAALGRVRDAVTSGQVRGFATTNAVDDVESGGALLAIASAADVLTAHVLSPHVRFVVPTEGGLLSSMNMVIPIGAHKATVAEKFVDYMSSPDPSARIVSFANVVSPIVGDSPSLQAIDVKAAANPLLSPSAAEWARLKVWGGTSATATVVADFTRLAAAHAG